GSLQRVCHRRHGLVLDTDQRGRVRRSIGIVRDDRDHGFAGEADEAVGQRGLAVRLYGYGPGGPRRAGAPGVRPGRRGGRTSPPGSRRASRTPSRAILAWAWGLRTMATDTADSIGTSPT